MQSSLDLWYKIAIIYSLDVETYMDSNGDGVGDFEGLTKRLAYLSGLGVTCLWLLPFYPSQGRDDGYAVTDYYSIDPRFGTLGDFVEFLHEARERGIRVIIDLVVQHTSDQHPWFQAARADTNSPFRDFFIWSDDPPPSKHIIFPGEQEGNWEYDEAAGQYYRHTFYKYQPDLNFINPAVREEIRKIMGFWLEVGVSGFRLDAVPFMIDPTGLDDAVVEDPHLYLREMRDFLNARRGDAVFLAEAGGEPAEVDKYFGDGDEMHMVFNFLSNQYLFLALARQAAADLARGLEILPSIPRVGQWANFLRVHDELNLDKLTETERQEIFTVFAPEENMQIYGRGTRRRLAPMLGGDPRRIRLAASLLLTLPGTPILYYGDEIGLGEELSLHGRLSVRTPMQWSPEPNGGFSTAPEDELVRPLVKGAYGYERVNVRAQRRDPNSLLNWTARALRARKEYPEFARGEWRIFDTGQPAVFAHCCLAESGTAIAVHNLADRPGVARLELGARQMRHLAEIFGDREYEPVDDPRHVQLDAYGFRWFHIRETE